MWILLLITTIGISPPKYEFEQRATTQTMVECIRMLESLKKQDIGSNQQFYCVKPK